MTNQVKLSGFQIISTSEVVGGKRCTAKTCDRLASFQMVEGPIVGGTFHGTTCVDAGHIAEVLEVAKGNGNTIVSVKDTGHVDHSVTLYDTAVYIYNRGSNESSDMLEMWSGLVPGWNFDCDDCVRVADARMLSAATDSYNEDENELAERQINYILGKWMAELS